MIFAGIMAFDEKDVQSLGVARVVLEEDDNQQVKPAVLVHLRTDKGIREMKIIGDTNNEVAQLYHDIVDQMPGAVKYKEKCKAKALKSLNGK